MLKTQALYSFWSSFGWDAIDEQSAYDENAMKALNIPDRYITFESGIGEINEPTALTASLWQRSTSWTEIEQLADQIFQAVGYGGVKVNYAGGQLWITRRDPFSKRGPVIDTADWRRIIININAEFLSA